MKAAIHEPGGISLRARCCADGYGDTVALAVSELPAGTAIDSLTRYQFATGKPAAFHYG